MWKGPLHGFVKRLLTHQHCAHRSINQNWVVNPERKRQNPGSGWQRNHADSKKGGRGVNVRDKTCSKNRDTEKSKNQTSLGISLPLESGQLERWYFHLGASNGISVTGVGPPSPRLLTFSPPHLMEYVCLWAFCRVFFLKNLRSDRVVGSLLFLFGF